MPPHAARTPTHGPGEQGWRQDDTPAITMETKHLADLFPGDARDLGFDLNQAQHPSPHTAESSRQKLMPGSDIKDIGCHVLPFKWSLFMFPIWVP